MIYMFTIFFYNSLLFIKYSVLHVISSVAFGVNDSRVIEVYLAVHSVLLHL